MCNLEPFSKIWSQIISKYSNRIITLEIGSDMHAQASINSNRAVYLKIVKFDDILKTICV